MAFFFLRRMYAVTELRDETPTEKLPINEWLDK